MNKIIVVGTGNAALCAAIEAIDHDAEVVIIEKAPEKEKGGNTRLTSAALRIIFDHKDEVREILDNRYSDEDWARIFIEPYSHENFIEDIQSLGKGRPDNELVSWFTSQSYDIISWLKSKGVKFELAEYLSTYDNTKERHYSGGVAIQAMNGGEGMVESQLSYLQSKGAKVIYSTAATGLSVSQNNEVIGVKVRNSSGDTEVIQGAVVLGCGGFEANNAMRAQYLGQEWDQVRQRCVKYNTGEMLEAALSIGAKPYGHFTGAHITPIDPDSPWEGGLNTREKTNRLAFSWGVTVNNEGKRFIDEGRYWNNQIYVEVGKAILKQPDQIAYQIFDSQGIKFLEPYYSFQKQFYKSDSLEELSKETKLPLKEFLSTINQFNQSCDHNQNTYNPTILDGQSTKDIFPPKSNWALPITQPPFYAYPVVPGITFTFGGLFSNTKCEILDYSGYPIKGLYGCGEITGGYFYYAYPTGSGLIKGAVTGKEAGYQAAQYVKKF
ncbi:FAD-dependent tricarballylate dehydrogenase TcuA [Aureibacter tunicatorum]|uniref:Tricarballylate dehydrogenase n=1 Tax=Aureibacter tunicatorum TaxID=866807 RepID=A0AAE3XNF4_9BACT|nr:FAD-dependent tricarballylate dehydrogenase TcuA [Aureibacter tunicatorum]MDR6238279.1 tricarballylate dehydrogenase [Aureibacter tunicatorum]BDD03312.1 tricarballylate dehydrogenase [Aureibacter tunicatorum]